jgi:hypothetical protein
VRNGKMEGKGSLYHFVDGHTYIGDFFNGHTHGNIIKLSSDGSKVVGFYQQGELVKGTYTSTRRDIEYTG